MLPGKKHAELCILLGAYFAFETGVAIKKQTIAA